MVAVEVSAAVIEVILEVAVDEAVVASIEEAAVEAEEIRADPAIGRVRPAVTITLPIVKNATDARLRSQLARGAVALIVMVAVVDEVVDLITMVVVGNTAAITTREMAVAAEVADTEIDTETETDAAVMEVGIVIADGMVAVATILPAAAVAPLGVTCSEAETIDARGLIR